ncbi:hypothetical protein HDU88_008012 [Geranomyces variabilis]|nr:hypothetical protein HDU88_008012 [Geranomyces variabilis]
MFQSTPHLLDSDVTSDNNCSANAIGDLARVSVQSTAKEFAIAHEDLLDAVRDALSRADFDDGTENYERLGSLKYHLQGAEALLKAIEQTAQEIDY